MTINCDYKGVKSDTIFFIFFFSADKVLHKLTCVQPVQYLHQFLWDISSDRSRLFLLHVPHSSSPVRVPISGSRSILVVFSEVTFWSGASFHKALICAPLSPTLFFNLLHQSLQTCRGLSVSSQEIQSPNLCQNFGQTRRRIWHRKPPMVNMFLCAEVSSRSTERSLTQSGTFHFFQEYYWGNSL